MEISRSHSHKADPQEAALDPDSMTPFEFLLPPQAQPGDESDPDLIRCLDKIADVMVPPNPTPTQSVDPAATADGAIPPIYTYWGQFLDHEVTARTDRGAAAGGLGDVGAEPDGVLRADPQAIVDGMRNRRTPTLDLDCVYGDLTANQDFPLSEALKDPANPDKLRIGVNTNSGGTPPPIGDLNRDLPRLGQLANGPFAPLLPGGLQADLDPDGRLVRRLALIGDPRNDENLIVAQFHLSVLRFHNAVVDWFAANNRLQAAAPSVRFDAAKRVTQWTMQWLMVNDFLKTVASPGAVDDRLGANDSVYRSRKSAVGALFTPIEFSVAAFRFAHSMIRNAYDFNRNFGRAANGPVFLNEATLDLLFQFTGTAARRIDQGGAPTSEDGMRGAETLPANWIIEWDRFIAVDFVGAPDGMPARAARAIDTRLAPPLGALRNEAVALNNLARRNLRRGFVLRAPSGQALAQLYDVPALGEAEIKQIAGVDGATAMHRGGCLAETPLWFYILAEAQQFGGDKLGPLGSAIVVDTLISFAEATPHGYLALNLAWTPGDAIPGVGATPPLQGGVTRIGDFLRFGGVLT